MLHKTEILQKIKLTLISKTKEKELTVKYENDNSKYRQHNYLLNERYCEISKLEEHFKFTEYQPGGRRLHREKRSF